MQVDLADATLAGSGGNDTLVGPGGNDTAGCDPGSGDGVDNAPDSPLDQQSPAGDKVHCPPLDPAGPRA